MPSTDTVPAGTVQTDRAARQLGIARLFISRQSNAWASIQEALVLLARIPASDTPTTLRYEARGQIVKAMTTATKPGALHALAKAYHHLTVAIEQAVAQES